MKILVTGAAGFIGMHTALRLLARGDEVVGVDNLNDYYDVSLKQARLAQLTPDQRFAFHKIDIADRDAMERVFATAKPQRVIHLAAQAGVRYSLKNPHAYVDANVKGFMNILEGCRDHPVEHLVYASTSSVYGSNTAQPFSEHQNADHPVSLYAATKKANEVMAQSYSHLYRLPVTGLRFFTIYGPWGRPDMAMFLFVNAIMADRPIRLFNHGKMRRDFTYIDDVTRVVSKLIDQVPADDPAAANAPSKVYNVGNHHPEELMHVVGLLEQELGRTAVKELLPMQPGDVLETFADVSDLMRDTGFAPSTPIAHGVRNFVTWYRDHFKV
jgi:UDP-glucuronate 4-epimerase